MTHLRTGRLLTDVAAIVDVDVGGALGVEDRELVVVGSRVRVGSPFIMHSTDWEEVFPPVVILATILTVVSAFTLGGI